MRTDWRRTGLFVMVMLCCALMAGTGAFQARAAGMAMKMSATLRGSEQVPPVQSPGKGTFSATIPANNKSISYRLTFTRLSTRVIGAHIHAGARGTNGPIVVFFCGGGGRPACPPNGGTVTGTITAANVVGGGGIKRGDLAGLIKAIMDGNTYVNVHSTKYKDGEIRGQIASSM